MWFSRHAESTGRQKYVWNEVTVIMTKTMSHKTILEVLSYLRSSLSEIFHLLTTWFLLLVVQLANIKTPESVITWSNWSSLSLDRHWGNNTGNALLSFVDQGCHLVGHKDTGNQGRLETWWQWRRSERVSKLLKSRSCIFWKLFSFSKSICSLEKLTCLLQSIFFSNSRVWCSLAH